MNANKAFWSLAWMLLLGVAGCRSFDINSVVPEERQAALAKINDPRRLSELARNSSTYEDVRIVAVGKIAVEDWLLPIVCDSEASPEIRELAVEKLIGLDGGMAFGVLAFLRVEEVWLQLDIIEKLDKASLSTPEVFSKLMNLWRKKDIGIDARARVYLVMDRADFSAKSDQMRIAEVLTESTHWKDVFAKVSAKNDLVDKTVLLDLALGKYKGDASIAIWAAKRLDDTALASVITRGVVAEVSEMAVSLIKSGTTLLEVVLEKKNSRPYREKALARLLGGKSAGIAAKTLYLKSNEFWIASASLAKMRDADRADKEVVARSLWWLRNKTLPQDSLAFIYLSTTGGDYSAENDQLILAYMLVSAKNWRKVFEKISRTGDLKDQSILVCFADKTFSVDESVALWAVGQLNDEGLIAVIKSPMSPKVGFMAVASLKSQDAIAKVATGSFSQISRIEAINRLDASSADVLRGIAKSNDANFRQVALDRIAFLGHSVDEAKKEADEVSRKEQAEKAEKEERLRQKREEAINAAKKALELARIDESIVSYREKLHGGTLAGGERLQFKGTITSIVSKSWMPKIRIEVKGAKETMQALCLVLGKFSLPIEVGDSVSVTGNYKKGSATEVTLSNAALTIDAKGGGK